MISYDEPGESNAGQGGQSVASTAPGRRVGRWLIGAMLVMLATECGVFLAVHRPTEDLRRAIRTDDCTQQLDSLLLLRDRTGIFDPHSETGQAVLRSGCPGTMLMLAPLGQSLPPRSALRRRIDTAIASDFGDCADASVLMITGKWQNIEELLDRWRCVAEVQELLKRPAP